MTDPTTILYALSTLAQTCAALAAFVGAVGLFRLQVLRDNQRRAEQDLRALAGRAGIAGGLEFALSLPLEQIVREVEQGRGQQGNFRITAAVQALDACRTLTPRFRLSRNWLVAFETWNLLVIFVSLVGFNYVLLLASSSWTFWVLWVVALGTVGVTGWCVYAWTRE